VIRTYDNLHVVFLLLARFLVWRFAAGDAVMLSVSPTMARLRYSSPI
jgi:hypothetical protein